MAATLGKAAPAGPATSQPSLGARLARVKPLHVFLAIGLLGAIAHAPGLRNGFTFDDAQVITGNADVVGSVFSSTSNTTTVASVAMPSLAQVFRNDYWGASMSDPLSHNSYRPLTTLTLRATAALGRWWYGLGGDGAPLASEAAALFHATDTVLHGIMCVLVGALAWTVVPGGRQRSAAFASAALFAVHPVHVDAVASASGRADVLAGVCAVASLLCYRASLRTTAALRRTRVAAGLLAAALVLAAVGTVCKEVAVTVLGLHVVLHLCDPMEGPILVAAASRAAMSCFTRARGVLGWQSGSEDEFQFYGSPPPASKRGPRTPARPKADSAGAAAPNSASTTAGSVSASGSDSDDSDSTDGLHTPPPRKPCSPDAGAGQGTPTQAFSAGPGAAPGATEPTVAAGAGSTASRGKRRRLSTRHKPMRVWRRTNALGALAWPLASVLTLALVMVARLAMQGFTLPTSAGAVVPAPDNSGGMLLRFSFGEMDNPAMWHATPRMVRWLTLPYVHARHAWLLVWPATLSADYSGHAIGLITSPLDPRFAAALCTYAAVAAGVYLAAKGLAARRAWAPCAALSAALTLLPFLPSSNLFFGVGFVVAERVLYLPSVGACLLAGLAWSHIRTSRKAAKAAALVVVVLLLAGRTWVRTGDWESDHTLWRSAVDAVPTNEKARFNLGLQLEEAGQVDAAMEQYQAAAAINPGYSSVRLRLAVLLEEAGRTEECLGHYDAALQADPGHAGVHNRVGAMFYKHGRADRAAHHFAVAVALQPEAPHLHLNLGHTLLEAGNKTAALASFTQALALAGAAASEAVTPPGPAIDPTATRHLVAQLHSEAGRDHDAVEHLMLGVRGGVRAVRAGGAAVMSDAEWEVVQRLLGSWQVGRETLTAQVAATVLAVADSNSDLTVTAGRPAALVASLADLGHLLVQRYNQVLFGQAAFQASVRLADGLAGRMPDAGMRVVARVRLGVVLAARSLHADALTVLDQAQTVAAQQLAQFEEASAARQRRSGNSTSTDDSDAVAEPEVHAPFLPWVADQVCVASAVARYHSGKMLEAQRRFGPAVEQYEAGVAVVEALVASTGTANVEEAAAALTPLPPLSRALAHFGLDAARGVAFGAAQATFDGATPSAPVDDATLAAMYARSIRMVPSLAPAYVRLGNVFLHAADVAAVEQAVEPLRATTPSLCDGAEACYRAALDRDADNVQGLNNMCVLEFHRGAFGEALRWCTAALDAAERTGNAEVAMQRGNLAHIRKAAAAAGYDPDAALAAAPAGAGGGAVGGGGEASRAEVGDGAEL